MYYWLIVILAYLPFQIALNPTENIDLASVRIIILAFFCIWLIQGFIKKKYRLDVNLGTICILGFLLTAILSVVFSDNRLWGIRKFLFFGSIFPLFFIAQNLIDSWPKAKKIISVMVIGAGVISLIGFGQYMLQFFWSFDQIYVFWGKHIMPLFLGNNLSSMILQYPSWMVEIGNGNNMLRAFSIYADPHMLAFYLGMILPFSIALYFNVKKSLKKPVLAVVCLMYLVLLLTFTRGAYMAVIGSFVVLAWLLWKNFQAKLAAILLLLSLMIFIIPNTPISYRFYSIFNMAEESNLGRIDMWQKASKLGQKNIMTGVGLGNYSVEIKPELGYRNPTTAHNLYLDIFSEMGIFALMLWVVLIFKTLWLSYKKMTILDKSNNTRWLYFGIAGSLIYYALHSIFETAIYQPVILAVLMIIVALAYARIKNTP